MSRPSILIVVPARMASTRFPGKPLVDLGGKPMVQWVVERANACGLDAPVLVATPDQEIIEACLARGIQAELTRQDHPSGTDRIAEVALRHGADVYVNVQGDEPLVDPDSIRACAQPLLNDHELQMGSVWAPCTLEEEGNPAVVKVVTDLAGVALYFSRHPIPFPRSPRAAGLKKHVGLYAYRREAVLAFAGWTPTPLETTEGLEQLRFLEHGVRIMMSEGKVGGVGVDTPDQAEEVRKIIRESGLK